MLIEKLSVEGDDIIIMGYRYKQVSAYGTYFILDISFLPAGFRIAETDTETVVGTKACEQLGLGDLITDTSADSCGIVEYKFLRNSADISEYILKSLAHTFGSLTSEDLNISVIAEWK